MLALTAQKLATAAKINSTCCINNSLDATASIFFVSSFGCRCIAYRLGGQDIGCASLQCQLDLHGKNGFVTATKLGTTHDFFVASTKNFAAATKRFVDRTKHFVVTKYSCYPYFNK